MRSSRGTSVGRIALEAGRAERVGDPDREHERDERGVRRIVEPARRAASANENASCASCEVDEEPAPVDDVGEQAAERRQEQQRPELGEEEEPTYEAGEPVSLNAYAPSTTFCIHVPMFDANVPK